VLVLKQKAKDLEENLKDEEKRSVKI